MSIHSEGATVAFLGLRSGNDKNETFIHIFPFCLSVCLRGFTLRLSLSVLKTCNFIADIHVKIHIAI